MTAKTIKPPTPTTTPMMVLRVCTLIPDVEELAFWLDDRLAVWVVAASVV